MTAEKPGTRREQPGGIEKSRWHAERREQQIRLRRCIRARINGYDGTQHPWEFKRVWHLEPSLHDPEHVYAGVEDAALFESKDGGKSWKELSGLRKHDTGPKWQPGAGGMCLHTILLDPQDPQRIFVAISAAGAFRTDDGGKTWKPINHGLHSAIHSRSGCRGRSLRPSDRAAFIAPEHIVHAKTLGRDAQR